MMISPSLKTTPSNDETFLAMPCPRTPRLTTSLPASILRPSLSLHHQAPSRRTTTDMYIPVRFLTLDDIPAADADFLALPSLESRDDDDDGGSETMPRLAPRFGDYQL